jgi:hypothetical protein
MAVTTTRKVKGRNFLPNKSSLTELKIKDPIVKGLTIDVIAKAEVPRMKMDGLEQVAYKVMDKYQKIIQEEAQRLNDEIIGLKGKAKIKPSEAAKFLKEAAQMAEATEKSINNALKSLQGAIDEAVQAELRKLSRDDRNLLEARIKVGIDITFGVIGIAGNITKLAVTGGSDVSSWFSLAKGIYDLAKIIHTACTDLDTRRKNLLQAIEKFAKEQEAIAKEELEAKSSKLGKVKHFGKAAIRLASGTAQKEAIACLKLYNNSVTKIKNQVYKDFSPKLNEAEKVFKNAQTVQDAQKLFKAFNDLKHKAADMTKQIDENEAFSALVKTSLEKMGAVVDLRPFTEKIFSKEGLIETAKFAKNTYSAASTLKDIVEAIVKAV